jgi:hypothetical protein
MSKATDNRIRWKKVAGMSAYALGQLEALLLAETKLKGYEMEAALSVDMMMKLPRARSAFITVSLARVLGETVVELRRLEQLHHRRELMDRNTKDVLKNASEHLLKERERLINLDRGEGLPLP